MKDNKTMKDGILTTPQYSKSYFELGEWELYTGNYGTEKSHL